MANRTLSGKISLVRNPDVVLCEEDPDEVLFFNPDSKMDHYKTIRVYSPK